MTDINVIIECGSGSGPASVTTRPLTDAEIANAAQIVTEAGTAKAARDAAEAARKNAVKQLKQQAKANGKVDATVIAQVLGIDINAPDPP